VSEDATRQRVRGACPPESCYISPGTDVYNDDRTIADACGANL
jgi:hypothetical protein